ncbi:unnamed protein product [Miscanthus lutarioriparius]|uniref:F-box domain-containing protein n=1 Tax=Miscanthus lutarioriparius TaxID=422564 RepID=A0A811RA45_9POAL|nr:unnamed protein product [Miscanthus lutarioriparius]
MERRQQRRKCKKAGGTETPATSVHDVPDDMLRLILLLLQSPLCLVRAAYTCRRWRGIVAADGGAVLRLARSLHPPFVVGHYHHRGSSPIMFVPSSLPAPIDCRRFSLDFLPLGASSWDVIDCHGGLVLLLERGCPLPKLLVCNPLTRRHRGMRYKPPTEHAGCAVADAFLLDNDDGGNISMLNFTVVYRLKNSGPGACVFATSSGGHGVRFVCASANDLDADCRGQVAGRVDGCLYLGLTTGSMIVLDKATLNFSQVDLPSRVDPSKKDYHASFRIVHGVCPDSSSPPMARIVHANGEEIEVFRWVHGTAEWVLEHSIPRLSEVARGLPSYLAERPFHWAVKVIADGVGFAVLSVLDFSKRKWLFTVDVDTMEVQFIPESTYHLYRGTRATSTYTLPEFKIMLA